MGQGVNFFNFSINKILSNDQSAFDQSRIRFLYNGFWLVFGTLAALLVSVYLHHKLLLTFTAGFALALISIIFKFLTYRPNWRPVSHILLIAATLMNLSNVFLVIQKVDIIAVQVILMIMLFGFYMLGQWFGLLYSLLNILPLLVFFILTYTGNYRSNLTPETIDGLTNVVGIFVNFIIILYVQYHFYKAFLDNTKRLKESTAVQTVLNQSLQLAIKKAEKSSQVKTEFLSTMSHEIRTPLNAIMGMANLMMMSNPRADQKENLRVLKLSANNLLTIVNDVLDFNKIESGQIVFENVEFNMVELMQNVCGAQILKAEEKGLTFNLQIDPFLADKALVGDPVRISQILYNLVSNAIKFTHEGSILVNVYCTGNQTNTVTVNFIVKDTGIGINKGNLKTIFEPFVQESITDTRQYGGTGLGLAIVKRLLELQGKQMQVSSQIGKGSAFSFDMEFALSIGESTAKKEAIKLRHDELSNLKILIAEDNPVNVLLMKKLLSKWNISPIIAENGERAVEILKAGDFDIILMDLQMPVLDGFDAAKEIRKLFDCKKANIPIIALTAASLPDIRAQITIAGMNDYVAKPFRPEELMERIQRLVAPSVVVAIICNLAILL